MSVTTDKLLRTIQSLLARFGVQIVSTRRLARETELLMALFAEAATAEQARHKGSSPFAATGVIFSFNRPMQLELLLRSYYKLCENPQPLVVQYGVKGEHFAQAYTEFMALYPGVRFIKETSFRETLRNVMESITTPNLFFLVDDIVFTRPMDMAAFCALDTKIYLPSLRLAPTLGFSYTDNTKAPPPIFSSGPADMLTFNWNETGHEWSYPMSVDGHMFNTAEMKVMTKVLAYKAPNSFEGALMRMAPAYASRKGVCFTAPKILNNPCNKVQSEVANKAGNVTPESLLQHWQNGEQIALEPFLNYPNTSPHTEVALTFEARLSAATTKRKAA